MQEEGCGPYDSFGPSNMEMLEGLGLLDELWSLWRLLEID